MTTLGEWWAWYGVGQREARRDWAGEFAGGWWWEDDAPSDFADLGVGFAEGFSDELSRLVATDREADR